MSDFVNTIDLLGDDAVATSIIDRSITEFKDDVVTSICYGIFNKCAELHTVDVPNVNAISNANVFANSNLSILVLRISTVCTLSHTTSFNGTPIASGTGYIYVPAALIDSYKTATNWSTYADQFRALEDYTVDGTTTGDLDETKI